MTFPTSTFSHPSAPTWRWSPKSFQRVIGLIRQRPTWQWDSVCVISRYGSIAEIRQHCILPQQRPSFRHSREGSAWGGFILLCRLGMKGLMHSRSLHDPGSSNLATKGVLSGPSGSSGERTSQILHTVEPAGTAPLKKVFQGSGVAAPTHVEAIKRLVHRTSFCREVAEAVATDLTRPTSCLLLRKVF